MMQRFISLTVIPSLPYYASLGLAYSAELPAMDDLKAGSQIATGRDH